MPLLGMWGMEGQVGDPPPSPVFAWLLANVQRSTCEVRLWRLSAGNPGQAKELHTPYSTTAKLKANHEASDQLGCLAGVLAPTNHL